MHSVQINFSSFCGVFMKKPELHKEIGQRLKLIRHIIRDGSKISAREFGERFDETRDNIANYETGRAPVPIRLLHGLFYFGFNPIYLITGDGSFFAPNARGKELERKISLNKKINVFDPEALKAEIFGETSPKKLPVYKVAAGAPKKSNKPVKAAPVVEEAPRRRGRPRLIEAPIVESKPIAKPVAKAQAKTTKAAPVVVEARRRGRPKLSETPIPMVRPNKKAAKPAVKAIAKAIKPAPAPIVVEAPRRRGRPRLSEAPIAVVRPAAKTAKAVAKPVVKAVAKVAKPTPAPIVVEAPKRRGRPKLSEAPIAVVRPAAKASKPVAKPVPAKAAKPVAKATKKVVAPIVEEAPKRRGRPRLSEAPIAEVRPPAKTAKATKPAAKPAPAKATKPAAKAKNQDTKRRGRPSLSEMAARAMAAVGMAPIQPPAKPVVMPDPMDTSNRKRYVEERQLAEARNKNRNKKNFKR